MLLLYATGQLTVATLAAYLIALTVGMTVHEFAHNYVAYLMGDPYPKRWGRLTLNPLVHINWQGWLMFAVIGFGILGSAPISPDRLPRENRRWRWLAAVAAGPVSNLLLAIVIALIFRIAVNPVRLSPEVVQMVITVVFLNVFLFMFNLIPLFPVDGWHIVYSLLPADLAYTWQKYQTYSYYAFMALIFIGFVAPSFNLLGRLVSEPAMRLTILLLLRI